MQKLIFSLIVAVLVCQAQAGDVPVLQAEVLQPLPVPLSNNAVTGVKSGGREFLISFTGLAEGRGASDALAATYVFDAVTSHWKQSAPVPGGIGRLAATAASVGELAFVFGGYSLADAGAEVSTAWVHSFDPVSGKFERRKDMPVPVDDSVAVAYLDRYIYLISGWHDDGNVNLTQRYDTETDTWAQATPIPGAAVFGHAGGIVANRLIYCDGVAIQPQTDGKREFVSSETCFLGVINPHNSRRIDWRTLPAHPGLPRYRMAAAGLAAHNAVLFLGGSENPYNYDGIGYDGEPSEPASDGLLFNLETATWTRLPQPNAASMDHRGLVPLDGRWLTIGGMLSPQRVTARVVAYALGW